MMYLTAAPANAHLLAHGLLRHIAACMQPPATACLSTPTCHDDDPAAAARYTWAHGGAGVVLSHGLMSQLVDTPAEECAMTKEVRRGQPACALRCVRWRWQRGAVLDGQVCARHNIAYRTWHGL